MTILDAVNATAGFTAPDAKIATKAVIDALLLPTADYDPTIEGLQAKVDGCAVAVLMAYKILSRIDQAGFAVGFDSKAADENITFLCNRSGLPNPLASEGQPIISDVTDLW